MKKIISLCLVAISILVYSCGEKDLNDKSYSGPRLVEFAKSVNGGESTFLVENAGQVFRDTVVVQLIGSHRNSPITVTWSLNSSSTAVDGVHYNMISPNDIQIEAGSSFAYIVFEGFGDGFADPSDVRTLDLEITNVDGAEISVNGASVQQELSITCPSDLAGSYTYDGGKPATINEINSGNYSVSGDDYFGTDYEFTISDICNEITVTGGEIQSNFGIPISGYGTSDPATNTITIYYTVDGYFADREMILTKN